MDLHEIRNPMRHPLVAAALQEEDADAALDTALEDALLRRNLNTRDLARAA